jgi:hypothetical protein
MVHHGPVWADLTAGLLAGDGEHWALVPAAVLLSASNEVRGYAFGRKLGAMKLAPVANPAAQVANIRWQRPCSFAPSLGIPGQFFSEHSRVAPTKPTEPPFVGFVGTGAGQSEKKSRPAQSPNHTLPPDQQAKLPSLAKPSATPTSHACSHSQHAEHTRQLDLANATLVGHHSLNGPEMLQPNAAFSQPFRRLEMHQRTNAETGQVIPVAGLLAAVDAMAGAPEAETHIFVSLFRQDESIYLKFYD